jgi:membrane-bound ClpP family serine protease
MAEHPLSSIIAGIIFLAGGLILILLSAFGGFESFIVMLVYGIPMFIIGIILLFWKKEDEIEQRKDLVKMKGGKKK